ncbi:MAG: methyltransferase domain-containing protein [Chloroflexi bacterium]|nr:methyltransferase domain-containing protein [Chloroflexota bacterium]
MSTTFTLTTEQAAQRDAFVERMLKSTSGVFDIFTIYIGDQLGFYRALTNGEALTSVELATRTTTHERYVREWLEQQTVAGILEVENPTNEATVRLFRLPAPHAEVLAARDSLNYLAPLAQLVVGAVHPLAALLDAYRTGKGVPFSDYGVDVREGQAGMNRAMFLQELGQVWLPAISDIHARLQADPPAHVADFGCGAGWSSIGIAQAYPKIQVDGFDLDEPSIELAQANLRETNLNGRVKFQVRDAGDPLLIGQYDLVTAFECVHDMSDPVNALRTMRRLINSTGAVIIVDERVGDIFTPTGNEVEWMMYGWSVLHCLPVGMVDPPAAGTGTVMRTDTLRRYAQEAGFHEVEVLPIDNFFFRFYRLIA